MLVGKDDIRNYRGARVKRTIITAIECVSADDASANKENHIRKRKNTTPEADAPEPKVEAQVAED